MKTATLDFNFPDEDRPLLEELGNAELSPIFIMGLHRSGTTFLYQSLAQVYSLAPLTAYDIVFYHRLLKGYDHGTQANNQASLDQLFSKAGVRTRQVDNIQLSHKTVEEYCWLLKKYAGSVHLNERTFRLFEEMCRKLLHLHPNCNNVLMKNPWDTGLGPQISTLFPKARFIYIFRDPIRILNSQLKAAETFAANYSPYLDLLIRGFPLARLMFTVQRVLYRALGSARFRALMVRRLMRDMTRELRGYQTAISGLRPDTFLEISYERLSAEPGQTLTQIGNFLGLAPKVAPESIRSQPRIQELLPEVQRIQERFVKRLRKKSLIREKENSKGTFK